jgi:hypothetical protein
MADEVLIAALRKGRTSVAPSVAPWAAAKARILAPESVLLLAGIEVHV